MWIQSTLLKIKKETDQTWRFFIKSNEDFDFVAGQFVRIKINDIVRSYSIASFNSSNNIFELLIVRLDGGKMTNLLFNKIKEGDKLEIKGPLGRFTLPENIDGDMLFICTGTGLAPFRSILQSIQLTGINHYKIYLIFGTRTSNDLLCFDEMIDFQRKIDGFKFIPVLSREKWSGNQDMFMINTLNLLNLMSLKTLFFIYVDGEI